MLFIFEQRLHLPNPRTGGVVRRESAQVPEALLSAVDINGPIDGVFLIKRTGVSLAAWTRKPIASDVLAVMSATLLGSVDMIVEALGGPHPKATLVDVEGHRILATKVNSQLALVLVSVREVGDAFLRQEARRIITAISAKQASERAGRREKSTQPLARR